MEYKVELFQKNIDSDNKSEFQELLNVNAREGWKLEKLIPQIDSYSDSFEDASGFSVDCCANIATDSIVMIFSK